MAKKEHRGWFRWRPMYAENLAYQDIAEAVAGFEPEDGETGQKCAEWLKEHALPDYPSTATWLYYERPRVEGFVSICSGNATLYDSGRSEGFRRLISGLPGARYRGRVVPATEIRWLGRHRRAHIGFDFLLNHAADLAAQVAEVQGNIALVMEPHSETAARPWIEQYQFRRAVRHGQLWLPLPKQEDLAN